MSEHDTRNGTAPRAGRPQGTPQRTPAPVPTGPSFVPVTLRPAVDVEAAEARLAALGQSRSTTALGERADLLRTLGRLDEALAIAEEAFRLAHFTGDRADSTAARIRRAHVLREQGKLERALNDLHTSRITASTEEWRELEAAAAELQGYTLHDLGRTDEARVALADALEAYVAAGVPRQQTEGLRYAIEAVLSLPEAPVAPAVTSAPGPDRRPSDTNPVPLDARTAGGPPDEARPEPAARPEVDGPWRTREIPTAGEHVDEHGPTSTPGSPADVEAGPAERAAEAERPAPRDNGLWGKISNLAANAAARSEQNQREREHGDEPRPGVTGVTGTVEGLPRDDEPTTWPFPRR
ncbi:tetratricopeptide repeat protein [Frigoribacterium salinisoli]